MKLSKLLSICMCCLLTTTPGWGQASSGQSRPGVLGYYNPQTRIFRPLPRPTADTVEPPALTTVTGTVTLTINITLKTAGITNVSCIAGVSVSDGPTTNMRTFDDAGLVAATGTGSTRTCKVTVPYSWALATQSSDQMTTSYLVTNNPFLKTAPPDRASLLNPLDTRIVPASGTITALTANVTL